MSNQRQQPATAPAPAKLIGYAYLQGTLKVVRSETRAGVTRCQPPKKPNAVSCPDTGYGWLEWEEDVNGLQRLSFVL